MADALVIFKPDASHRLAVRNAMSDWLMSERNWKLAALRWFQPTEELIAQHYDFLQGRPFFPWLVDFMSALPVVVGRVTAEPQALEEMRYELGETRIAESRPGSLRERYGIGGGVNCVHLSDSAESGEKETRLWARYLQLDEVEAGLEPSSGRPDHTFHLRSLASQFGAGVHKDLAAQEITRLLREESDLGAGQFDALVRIVLGAFA
jgi:nucleoside-diphosphate kinase